MLLRAVHVWKKMTVPSRLIQFEVIVFVLMFDVNVKQFLGDLETHGNMTSVTVLIQQSIGPMAYVFR